MSTAYVVSQCCQAPVRLAFPNLAANCAEVICTGCGRTAGTPGAEDSPDVEEFLTQPVPLLTFRWLTR